MNTDVEFTWAEERCPHQRPFIVCRMVASSYPSDEDRLPPNVTSGQLWGESVRNFDSTSDIVCTLYKPPPFKTSSKSFGKM